MNSADWINSLKPQTKELDLSKIDWRQFLPPKLEVPNIPSMEEWKIYKKAKKKEIRLRVLKSKHEH